MKISKTLFAILLLLPIIPLKAPAAQALASAPSDVTSLAPQGTKLIFFKTDGAANPADAIAVFEKTGLGGDGQRILLVLHKQNDSFRLVDRNDKLIACTSCGQFRDDPFLSDGDVSITPGHIHISQMDSGETQSGVVYDFALDPATSQWKVTSGERITASDMGHGPATKQNPPLPKSGLLKDVDPQWQPASYWNGVIVDDRNHRMSTIFSASSEKDLDSQLQTSCDDASSCHVILKQQDGCFAVAKDSNQAFFPAAVSKKRAKSEAVSVALSSCQSKGSGECKIQRSGCSTGFE